MMGSMASTMMTTMIEAMVNGSSQDDAAVSMLSSAWVHKTHPAMEHMLTQRLSVFDQNRRDSLRARRSMPRIAASARALARPASSIATSSPSFPAAGSSSQT